MWPLGPWTYPDERYYYTWWAEEPPTSPSDGEIKSMLVGRLQDNGQTRGYDLRVDVKQGVAVLGGTVSSWVAKRAAGDDAWDTPGVVDVSNQIVLRRSGDLSIADQDRSPRT